MPRHLFLFVTWAAKYLMEILAVDQECRAASRTFHDGRAILDRIKRIVHHNEQLIVCEFSLFFDPILPSISHVRLHYPLDRSLATNFQIKSSSFSMLLA